MPNRSMLEDLSDEILMDIFDSLPLPSQIYSSFFNLNERFNEILRDSRLLMSVDASRLNCPVEFAYHCQVMFPQMSKQLISLRLSNEPKFYEQIEMFLRHQRFHSFPALRQLALIQISFDQLRRTFVDLISLNKLTRLEIDMFDGSGVTPTELNLIANIFFSKSNSIRTLNLRFNRECLISDSASPSLKDFSLDCCFAGDVPRLLQLSSNLQRLKLKVEQSTRRTALTNLTNIEFQQYFSSSTIRSSLTEFHLEMNDLTFHDVHAFLLFLPNLTMFRLEGLTYDLNLSKADLWQNLLEKHLKFLKKLQLVAVRIWLGNNADDHQNTNHTHLVQDIYRSFGKTQSFWGQCWSVDQMHKLRPNHLSLT